MRSERGRKGTHRKHTGYTKRRSSSCIETGKKGEECMEIGGNVYILHGKHPMKETEN